MSNTEPVIRLEKDENIALVSLNRPEKLNAFSVEMRNQLYDIILAIRDDPTVDAVVLYGEGRGFCAGADLTEFGTEPSVLEKRRIRLQLDLWEEIRRISKPIAAALHGFAIGSGLEMSMLCDFRFAAPGTKLGLPEPTLGMIPAAGGTQSLPRLVDQGLALDFALGDRQIKAEEAGKLRLISDIFPAESLIGSTVNYMKKLVSPSPSTAKSIKSLVAHGMDMSLSQGLERERAVVARSWLNWEGTG